jgi:glutamate synthase (NADPH/NADH) small chain
MADPKGFLKIRRKNSEYRPVCERIKDYREVVSLSSERHSQEQASRCMDCGTPFCHWACPIGNYIPEWNDLMFNGHWQRAFELLQATNNFPEISGRICPAICEFACVLGINDDPVTIRENELSVIEYAFKKDLLKPRPIRRRSGKKVAIVGSGPAGLACADQLNKAGHSVVVFEKDDRIGGILRYGIPDFKLEKWILDRRLKILQKEGIEFNPNVNVGIDLRTSKLKKEFDAICLAGGCGVARNLNIEGRNLKGIYFAMDYLTQANRRVLGQKVAADKIIDAKGKQVVIIGGGDTGADCVGTAHRQGAACVVQIELLPRPPECRSETMPWPQYPLILKTSTSHQEGGVRYWSVLTKRFIGNKGRVKKILCVKVDFSERDQRGCAIMREVAGSEFEIEADLVILAIGFLHPQHQGLLKELGIELDRRGNVKTDKNYMASIQGVFSAGDMRRGQSLVVWAIYEGRQAARSIDKYLMGKTFLPKI